MAGNVWENWQMIEKENQKYLEQTQELKTWFFNVGVL